MNLLNFQSKEFCMSMVERLRMHILFGDLLEERQVGVMQQTIFGPGSGWLWLGDGVTARD